MEWVVSSLSRFVCRFLQIAIRKCLCALYKNVNQVRYYFIESLVIVTCAIVSLYSFIATKLGQRPDLLGSTSLWAPRTFI